LVRHLISKQKDKLLFIEDIGEMIYSTDRMLQQLKRSGKLDGLAGLIMADLPM
jgi:muramoyltetrapeptide carboxypeptidase